jgi:hypothetical protein
MRLSSLLRPPLVWFTAAETALIGVLGVLTWHVWVERVAPAAAALGPPVAAAPPPPSVPGPAAPVLGQPPPAVPSPGPPAAGPTPGIRTDAEFLGRQLSELNRVEATFEDLEWRVTKAIADAIERYVQGVVLPSIERSEQSR